MVRAPFYDKNGLKKGAWSREEDEKLRSFIQRNGLSNWRLLPKFAGLARCGKSCRLRWMNYLRPNLKHGGYTQEEEEIIIKLHQEVGNKWSRIAEKLPGRSDNEIKNHWHSHLKKSSKRSEMTTSELKSKPCDTSRFTESESPGADVVADSFHILESSLPVSSDPELTETSCTEENNYSLTSNDTQATASNSRSEEESVAPWVVTFDEFSSDFWTDPFIVEDTYSEEKNRWEDIALSIPYFYEGTDLL